ncbi:MAG: Lactoylglutathione lyase @ Cadmium-induced protein CadI, partial [uncultured Acidimicrobiales bacterium]
VPSPARPQRQRRRGRGGLLLVAVRRGARQAPARLRQLLDRRAAAQAGPHRERSRRRHPEPPGRRGPHQRRGGGRLGSAHRLGARDCDRGSRVVLLRRAGQGLGGRPRRGTVGGLHGARRRGGAAWRPALGRHLRRGSLRDQRPARRRLPCHRGRLLL